MNTAISLLLAVSTAFTAAPAAPRSADQPATRPAAAAAGAWSGPWAPATLPGKGLAQHPFFYAGEGAPLKVFIVREGKVAWEYTQPPSARGAGEISDGMLLSNGNVLIAYQFGAALVSPEKKVLWQVEAPGNTEIHTAQALGTNRIMYVQNGEPALLKIVNVETGNVEKELTVPTGNPKSVHGQFRRARVLHVGDPAKETFLLSHMDMNKVAEYDGAGKEIWSVAVANPWSASRLKNGNTLIASNRNFVREVNPAGETVWEFKQSDVPEIRIFNTQTAYRLANGNTIINNWRTPAGENLPVQFLEVTPEKKVVWAVRAWGKGEDEMGKVNLGPSTNIQLLDDPGTAENGDLQR